MELVELPVSRVKSAPMERVLLPVSKVSVSVMASVPTHKPIVQIVGSVEPFVLQVRSATVANASPTVLLVKPIVRELALTCRVTERTVESALRLVKMVRFVQGVSVLCPVRQVSPTALALV